MSTPYQSHELTFSGHLLKRGFWLYVWEIKHPDWPTPQYYVGRTGDSSSVNAASPFNRMGQHLNLREGARSAMLTNRLEDFSPDIKPSEFDFRLISVGPILDEIEIKPPKKPSEEERADHNRRRDIIAALESSLEKAMRAAGYEVLNRVHSRKVVADEPQRQRILTAFAHHFPKLGQVANKASHDAGPPLKP